MAQEQSPGLTERLAEQVVAARYQDFSPIVIERAKELILDGLANMLAGSREPLGAALKNCLKAWGGNPQSTAIGTGIKTSAPWAALANGTFCRSMDYDPPHPGNHPVGGNLPAGLAIAEKDGLPGWRLVEAFVIAVEIHSRTFEARNSAPKPPGTGGSLHNRGISSMLSAAIGASKLLGLNVYQTRMALGIAAARTGGIDSAGTMCNPGDAGNAACCGVQAAMLAQAGFTGRESAIEQRFGFGQFLGEGADIEAIARDFPNSMHLEKETISIKKYPCQYPTHRHIEAILKLYRENPWRPEDIAAIEVELTLTPWESHFNDHSVMNVEPEDGMAGKFSVGYTAAVAAVDGTVGIESFSNEKRFSAPVVDMLRRVTVKVSSERPSTYNTMWSEVTIQFKNGQSRKHRVGLHSGISGGVSLTRDERVAKFVDCALRVITKDKAQRVVTLVDQIEALDNLDELCTMLRAAEAS